MRILTAHVMLKQGRHQHAERPRHMDSPHVGQEHRSREPETDQRDRPTRMAHGLIVRQVREDEEAERARKPSCRVSHEPGNRQSHS